MADEVKIAFEKQIVILSLNDILPSKMLPPAVKESAKYRRIASSVAQLGLVEPLVVSRPKGGGPYLLLDGHVRFSAMRDQGSSQARCLIVMLSGRFAMAISQKPNANSMMLRTS